MYLFVKSPEWKFVLHSVKIQTCVANRNSEMDTAAYCNVCLLLCCGGIFSTAGAPLACCLYIFLENQLTGNDKTELPCNMYREGCGGHSGVADFSQTIIARSIGSFLSEIVVGTSWMQISLDACWGGGLKCLHLCQS
jgi:hypothetical protein